MRIVVCAKEVLDPDAVNNYALAGRLEIGPDDKALAQKAIPRLINAFDEQAIEAALRLRDAGLELTLSVVSIGPDPTALLKHAAALGADEIVAIEIEPLSLDSHATARVLSTWIESSGGADLILCGRQASDDDQGVVPALMAERLRVPLVAVARAVEIAADGGEGPELRVTRVTPDGDEVVRVRCPAIVTISNELGEPRFPNTARKLRARRMKPTLVTTGELGLGDDELKPHATVMRQLVPAIQGNCEFISGDTPAQTAQLLIARLREDRLLAPLGAGAGARAS